MNISYDLSIIIPFINEQENLVNLANELNTFAQKNNSINFEVILINDGSTDESVSVILNAQFPKNTSLICLSQNYGSHAALRAGIIHSKGDKITFLYADLQDPIENIETMYVKQLEGNDIVWANRIRTNNSRTEKWFSELYSGLMKKYVNKKYPPSGFDVVLFNRKVAVELNKNIESNSSIFLQILNMGFRQTFVEYQKGKRTEGKSKWTLSKKIKLFIDSFVAFSFAPIRLVSFIGILFFLTGSLWTAYIVFRSLVFDDLATGWPTLFSILMIGFGITNISLGIIAEYLWRTLDASRKRPVFIIDEVIELKQP